MPVYLIEPLWQPKTTSLSLDFQNAAHHFDHFFGFVGYCLSTKWGKPGRCCKCAHLHPTLMGREDENIGFNDLPESIKQCVYRKAGMDTQVLQKINVCSQKYGGANCVGRISELKSCFAWFWKTLMSKNKFHVLLVCNPVFLLHNLSKGESLLLYKTYNKRELNLLCKYYNS